MSTLYERPPLTSAVSPEIKPKLSNVKIKNQELKSLYQQFFAAVRDEERSGFSKQVEEICLQNNKVFSTVAVAMRQLDDSNKKFAKTEGSGSSYESRVRNNVGTILARVFLDCMIEFQDLQQSFKGMHSTRVRQIYQIANPAASQQELDEIAKLDLSVTDVFEQKLSATRHKQAQQALAYVRAKHNEIMQIERGLLEIQELFNQCAALVALQREFIDQISANIDRTYESLKQANGELYKARYFQKHRFALSAPQYDRLYKN